MSDLVNITGGWPPKKEGSSVKFSGFLKEDMKLEKGGKILIFKNKKYTKGSKYPVIDICYAPPDGDDDYKPRAKKEEAEEYDGDADDIPF